MRPSLKDSSFSYPGSEALALLRMAYAVGFITCNSPKSVHAYTMASQITSHKKPGLMYKSGFFCFVSH